MTCPLVLIYARPSLHPDQKILPDCFTRLSVTIRDLIYLSAGGRFGLWQKETIMRYQVYEKDTLVMETNDLALAVAMYKTCYGYARLGGIKDTHKQGYPWVM